MANCILEVKDLDKRFENIHAVKTASVDFIEGEIHSIIGENGAGKSTLMNLITGLYEPDAGKIIFKGSEIVFKSPADSLKIGIGIVHQHFMLIDEFTAVENIILGNEIKKNGLLDIPAATIKISELQDKYGFNFPLNKKVGELTVGEKQQIEILKILFREVNFFIFDEPTAVLTPTEVEGLYKIFRKLKENNNTIVFISHKLKEIFSISDRISVISTLQFQAANLLRKEPRHLGRSHRTSTIQVIEDNSLATHETTRNREESSVHMIEILYQ